MRHEDYLKAFYLVATVDFISRKNDIPLCDKYSSVRSIRLEQPYYVGDSSLFGPDKRECIDEFLHFNIYEGDLYDAGDQLITYIEDGVNINAENVTDVAARIR